jgi:hypothetical protein
MDKKTTVVYDKLGVIKNIELSVGMLEALQNLLIHYLSECKDHQEVVGEKDIQLEGIQSHIYILVALVQNLRMLALEQGIAKEVEVTEAVHAKAKEAAQLFLERDPNKIQDLNTKLAELHEVTKNFASS